MKLPTLLEGTLLRRYQRFLAEVRLASGETVTAHCPNTGAMLGLKDVGNRVWLSRADNPKRKLAYTWELVELADGVQVGIHTGRANGLVEEALAAGLIPALDGYQGLQREPRLAEGSRADFHLHWPGQSCHVEVKSVTAAVADGIGYFPDAVSVRARKHLQALAACVRSGGRAAVIFCVQRGDVAAVRPADHIDIAFGRALREAWHHGVELYALVANVSPWAIQLQRRLPVLLD